MTASTSSTMMTLESSQTSNIKEKYFLGPDPSAGTAKEPVFIKECEKKNQNKDKNKLKPVYILTRHLNTPFIFIFSLNVTPED